MLAESDEQAAINAARKLVVMLYDQSQKDEDAPGDLNLLRPKLPPCEASFEEHMSKEHHDKLRYGCLHT